MMNSTNSTRNTAPNKSQKSAVLGKLLSGSALKSLASLLRESKAATAARQAYNLAMSIEPTYQKPLKGSVKGQKVLTGKVDQKKQFAGYVESFLPNATQERVNTAHKNATAYMRNTLKLVQETKTGEGVNPSNGGIPHKLNFGGKRRLLAQSIFAKSAALAVLILALAAVKPPISMSTTSNLGETTPSLDTISLMQKSSAHLVTELFIVKKPSELLERPYSPTHHNVVGDDKRDGLKSVGIGKSAAKPLRNEWKVQRLGYGVPILSDQEWTVKAHECPARKRRYSLSYMETCRSSVIKKATITRLVSPTDTPVLTMCGKNSATGTAHDWLTDTLADAADNKAIEGNDVTGVQAASRSRLSNYTQILTKNALVTGTQEKVLKGGGVKSEMAYQLARRMKEMKRDGEFAIVGQSNAKVAGSESAAREMGSLDAYLVTNNQLAAGSSAPTGDGTDVSDFAGTDRALTETIFTAGLQDLYTNSGGNESVNAVVSAAHKGTISDFTSAATRYVTTDDQSLVASIDVYVGDFHTVRIIPDRYIKSGLMYIIDPEYLKCSELRPMQSFDLAKNGDSDRKQVVWEWTLEVCNEKAHVLIGDLS